MTNRFVTIFQWSPISGIEDHHPQGVSFVISEKFVNGNEVAQRFGHFFTTQLHHAIMEPVACHRFTRQALGLRNFVFMMGKNQIISTSMNVDFLTNKMEVHS